MNRVIHLGSKGLPSHAKDPCVEHVISQVEGLCFPTNQSSNTFESIIGTIEPL